MTRLTYMKYFKYCNICKIAAEIFLLAIKPEDQKIKSENVSVPGLLQ